MATYTINASSASRNMRKYGINYITQHDSVTADYLDVGSFHIGQWYVDPEYQIMRLALIFDTSGIPAGAKIPSAIMQIYPEESGAIDKNWDIVITNGQPTYPHNPVVVGDYLHSHYSGDGGSITVSTITDLTWNDIVLNATGIGWIQKGGTTKLIPMSSKDINSIAPTALERVYCADKTGIRLVIITSEITATTYTPTNIIRANPTVVTANGLIENIGINDITTRGFKYGLTETDTWTESESNSYSEGTFSLTLNSLTADTTYYIRAYAISAGETAYGSYVEFKTAYPYGPVKTEIKSEATASSGDIAAVGGKRSLTINNHLIQTQTIANLIANAYLADYKDQKTKFVVTRPTPPPYEIGDTIKVKIN